MRGDARLGWARLAGLRLAGFYLGVIGPKRNPALRGWRYAAPGWRPHPLSRLPASLSQKCPTMTQKCPNNSADRPYLQREGFPFDEDAPDDDAAYALPFFRRP